MNCPKCGAPLRISKKDANYGLCDNCKKRFRLPSDSEEKKPSSKEEDSSPKPGSQPLKQSKPHKQPSPYRQSKPKPHKQTRSHKQIGYYTDDQYDNEPHHKKKKYANIPPSKVRSSREDDMRSGYDELLSIENDKQTIGSSVLTVVILLIVLALIAGGIFFLYNRVIKGSSSSKIEAETNVSALLLGDNNNMIYETDDVQVTLA